jgi:alanyl aminopeptidase
MLSRTEPLAVTHPHGTVGDQTADPAVPTLRLPTDVRPTRQSVVLTVDPRGEKFAGMVEIEIVVQTTTPTLWLNGTNLAVRDASLEMGDRSWALRVIPGNENVIGFSPETGIVGPGSGRLRITYDGVISRRDMEGLFAQQEGSNWYAFTQFEPLGARRAFPCFDEPGYKIPWRVTLNIPEADAGFSNTPEASTTAQNGMKTIVFAETKPIPSYLVAVAVGPIDVVDAGKAGRNGTAVRILVPRGESANARWAVETTPRVLTLLEDYFDLPYPYEKLDQVTVPVFFGAMENAGLVTYGQTIMLQKAGEETISGRRFYVAIAAHELAHQWFGNLVTMGWWDDLWLNEAFASWMGQRIAERFGPDWGIDVDRVWSRSGALQTDSLTSARRVRQPIESVHDVANAFDGITYSKGEAIIEMFESWLGEDVFRRGVRQYIREHAWQNATVADFMAALSKAAGRDVGPSFSSFLDQPGAPLVTVDLKCGDGPPRVALAQNRYLPLGSAGSRETSWRVPVCVRYPNGKEEARQCTLLDTPTADLQLRSVSSCPAWVLGNDGYSGYYRVRHGADMLNHLLMDHADRLTVSERVGLLTDLPALIASGDVAAARALEVASRFASDGNRHIVNSTMSIVESVRQFVPETQQNAYPAWIRHLYSARARTLGWQSAAGEPEDARLLRAGIIRMAGTLGADPTLASEAVALANNWLTDSTAVEPDMVNVVLAVAARSGDSSFFDRLHEEAKRTTDRERRERLLGALAEFRAPQIVPKVLAIPLEPEIDPRESLWLAFALGSDPQTRDAAFDFVKAHYGELTERLPQGSAFDAAAFLPFVAAGFCDERHRGEVEAFFSPKVQAAAGGPRNLAQALESIDLCIAQRRTQEPSVTAFLSALRSTSH